MDLGAKVAHKTGPRAPIDDVAQRGHMRRAEAEAKAMAIGNIADVWRLNTVSPLQAVQLEDLF
jgi:hypothetical protein